MAVVPILNAALRRIGAALVTILLIAASSARAEGTDPSPWHQIGPNGDVEITLYVFWSQTCPHCREALPFIAELDDTNAWLHVRAFEVSQSRANVKRFFEIAQLAGEEPRAVPAFYFCGRAIVGFDSPEGTGRALADQLRICRDTYRQKMVAPTNHEGATRLRLPILGGVDTHELSLPLTTAVIAGLDAFNPCAFFVLLFLLSLLVHVHSRARMMVIGGVFVVVSGLVYFVFMAAWLNVFLIFGQLRAVTAAAGGVAVAFALIGIKDFVWPKRFVTLSIPEAAKPGLYDRMRRLIAGGSLPAMLAGTLVLAVFANTYELLCTSGFPMVYTRILTLNELSPVGYYAYLALYNTIYVVPLLAIVVAFTLTLGSRKLSEREGRLLKLLSGVMMLGLGLVLVVRPALLDRLETAFGILALALAVTAIAWLFRRPQVRRVSN